MNRVYCHESVWYFQFFFFFKQKTAYELRISDWSSDVCSSDLRPRAACRAGARRLGSGRRRPAHGTVDRGGAARRPCPRPDDDVPRRVHTGDRKRVVVGKSVSVRVDLGGRRNIKKKIQQEDSNTIRTLTLSILSI